MAKPPSSAIGVDLGRHSMKAVLLQRKGSKLALNRFATRELSAEIQTLDLLAANLKALLQELGGSAKACAIAVSSGESFIRIVEQPEMPRETLRDALRFNSQALLNMDGRDFVLDCDRISAPRPPAGGIAGGSLAAGEAVRYLVGGLPRTQVQMIHEAGAKMKLPIASLQLSPVAVFNAFEYSHEETFNTQGFVLVDIGHRSSEVIVGAKRELILARSLDYGGNQFVDELICHGASGPEEVAQALAEEEVLTIENARLSLTELVRSISSSIGFVEARHDEAIPRVFVSGGMAKSPAILRILSEELQLPCETWNPFAGCELALPAAKKDALGTEAPGLCAAFGAAAEILKGS